MMECDHGMCGMCHGVMKIVWGGLLLLNGFVWPMWKGVDGWIMFIAVLVVLHGVAKLVKPTCGHCGPMMMDKKKK